MTFPNAPTAWGNTNLSTSTATGMFSDDEGLPSIDNDDPLTHPGDYSTHMEELFEGDDTESNPPGEESEEDEADFLYSGVDADSSLTSYKAQLHDVLGQDHEDGNESDVLQVGKSLVLENAEEYSHPSDKTMVSA